MKKLILGLAVSIIAALPFSAHAQTVIYSDTFESDALNSQHPVGWTCVGSGTGNNAFVDIQGTATYAGTYSNLDGAHAVYLYLSGSGTAAIAQSNNFSNANIGQTFAANTTYTLNYLYAEFGGGPTNISFMANNVVVASTTKIITGGSTAFASGPTITIDTALNPSLVGQNIGLDFNWSPYTGQYLRTVGLDDLQVTATPDAPVGKATIGVNIEKDWFFTDVIHQSAHSQWNTSSDLWGSTAATVDSNGWPTQDFSLAVWGTTSVTGNVQNTGTYTLTFNGIAKVTTFPGYLVLPVNSNGTNGIYNAATNTTTATISDTSTTAENVALIFTNTQRTSSSGTNTGLTNIHMYRPTAPGAPTSFAAGTLFTPQSLALAQKFSTTRFLDLTAAINSTQVNWTDRNLPAFWSQNGSGTHPMAYEYAVAYCNAANTDLYLNIPYHATDAYVTNLAKLIKYGSDGVNPYSSTQASPVWAPLNSNLHVYFELSDEVWNSHFQQMHDNYNQVVADQTANNAEWAILNYDGASASNLWTGAWRLAGLRGTQLSNDFRAVYGDANMPPNANCTVRPLLEFQAQNGQSTGSSALHFLDNYYNNSDGVAHVTTPHPMNYFFWGCGGATYFTSNSDSASTVDAIFASGIPWSGYNTMVDVDAAVAKSYGLKRVAYEGGWALYNGTNGTDNVDGSAASAAKYDTRATAVLQNEHTSYEQTGGDLEVYYTASAFDINYVWGMTDSIFNLTVPLYVAVSNIDSSTPAAVTYGNPIAGSGSTTLAYGSQLLAESTYNSGLPDNGALNWVPLVSTAGNYQISLNINSTTAGKYVQVYVDGKLIGTTVNVPVSTTAQNVVVATVNLTAGQHGLIVRGQYASNNNYTGNSCTFTSAVLTKVP